MRCGLRTWILHQNGLMVRQQGLAKFSGPSPHLTPMSLKTWASLRHALQPKAPQNPTNRGAARESRPSAHAGSFRRECLQNVHTVYMPVNHRMSHVVTSPHGFPAGGVTTARRHRAGLGFSSVNSLSPACPQRCPGNDRGSDVEERLREHCAGHIAKGPVPCAGSFG